MGEKEKQVLAALDFCAAAENGGCEGCPYISAGKDCGELVRDAAEIIRQKYKEEKKDAKSG